MSEEDDDYEEESNDIEIDSWGFRINDLFEEISMDEKPTMKDFADILEQTLNILSEQAAKIIELCHSVKILDKAIVKLTGVSELVEGIKNQDDKEDNKKENLNLYA